MRMKKKISREFELTCFMVDSNYRMKASSFMEMAQEAAGDSADVLGFGYDVLRPMDMAWVLVRMQFRYLRAPMWREHLSMRTWHKGLKGPFFVRDYELVAEDGSTVAVATSCWVIMRLSDRSVVRMTDLGGIISAEAECEDSAIETMSPKVAAPRACEPDLVAVHKAVYSDIDFNLHANNTKYISWALDALPGEVCARKAIREVSLNFHREVRLGEEVVMKCFHSTEENGEKWTVEGTSDGQSSFSARIVFYT